MTKTSLRKEYLARRLALTEDSYQQQNKLIEERLWQTFNLAHYACIHIYLADAGRREVATWGIVHALFAHHPEVIVAVPQLVGHPGLIENRAITPQTTFQTHRWGMQEPVEGRAITATDVQLVILPVVAFDQQGYRVGYGKGHYDRFLAQCRPSVIKVGLCLEEPVSAVTDLHAHDVPMDYCVTPRQVWSRTAHS